MANTTVTKVSELLLTNVTAGAKAGDQKISDAADFTKVMNDAKDGVAVTSKPGVEDGAKASRTVVESGKGKEIKAEEPVRRDPVGNEEDMKDLTEEVAKEVTEISDKIKEVLDVSDEELTQAMENLGFAPADLLDPVNVRALCMDLKGIEDSISLLTNADLYEGIKEIVETVEGAGEKITADFSLTKDQTFEIVKDEDFAAKVEEAVKQLGKDATADTQPEVMNITEDAKDVMPRQDMDVDDQTDRITVNADKHTNEAVRTDAATVTVEVKGKPQEKIEPQTAETVTNVPADAAAKSVTETFKPATATESISLKTNEEETATSSRFAVNEAVTAVPQQTQVVNTTVNNLGQIVETVTTYTNTDAESIMNQVTQSIRVNYSADTTSMELQLHPASLGTVNMNIASAGGVVTAHILVENEAVKAALESQLITLQQTFEEQGQRVEAVEVSVANYDLNRGTGSEAGSGESDRNAGRTGRVGTRRRINLNDLDEEGMEELTEDEKLSADMMARSGNSVDYQA